MILFQSRFITITAKSFVTQLLFKSLIPIVGPKDLGNPTHFE